MHQHGEDARERCRLGLSERKLLGAWYTPQTVAEHLVRWALQGQPGPVLDPSFGGCSFLRAALSELAALGHPAPADLVAGVDLDAEATSVTAAELLVAGVRRSQLVYEDFLSVGRGPHNGNYAAVVGNPPYVRHHWHELAWQNSAQEVVRASGLQLPKRASAWAYFVVHAVRFLRAGGRLAFVLPGSILQADYSTAVLRHVRKRFASVRLVRVRERLFSADEESVFLLAAGRSVTPQYDAQVEYGEVSETSQAFRESLATVELSEEPGLWKQVVLPTKTVDLFRRLETLGEVARLGDMARVRLGVVTGSNSFFLRRAEELPLTNGSRRRTVVARSGWLRGARFTRADMSLLDRQGERDRLLLITPGQAEPPPELEALLHEGLRSGVAQTSHARKRRYWYSLEDWAAPDAFLPYMGANPRGLVDNSARATCTNAIHRVHWECDGAAAIQALIASWTTLFRFAYEFYGRHYGGGVLKVELRDARALPLPLVEVPSAAVEELDATFRRGGVTAANRLADRYVLRDGLGLSLGDIRALHEAADILRDRRAPSVLARETSANSLGG